MSKFRPVHTHKVGRLKINWRIGHYRWMWDADWSMGWVGVMTPWVYVFVGLPAKEEK